MNYAKIRNYDIANGEGVRTSLFVSGCTNHCPGCFNPEEQDFNCGRPFTKETIAEIHKMLANPVIKLCIGEYKRKKTSQYTSGYQYNFSYPTV